MLDEAQNGLKPHAAVAFAKGFNLEQHHCANDLFGDFLTNAARVRDQQVSLQLAQCIAAYPRRSQVTKPRIHAVNGRVGIRAEFSLQVCPATLNRLLHIG